MRACACIRVRVLSQKVSADPCVCVQVVAEDAYLNQVQDSGKPGAPALHHPPPLSPLPVGAGLTLIDEWKSHACEKFPGGEIQVWANFTPSESEGVTLSLLPGNGLRSRESWRSHGDGHCEDEERVCELNVALKMPPTGRRPFIFRHIKDRAE